MRTFDAIRMNHDYEIAPWIIWNRQGLIFTQETLTVPLSYCAELCPQQWAEGEAARQAKAAPAGEEAKKQSPGQCECGRDRLF